MKLTSPPKAEEVRDFFDYDPETGLFFFRHDRYGGRFKKGPVQAKPMSTGYLMLTMSGRHLLAHRVAWLHHYGEWPSVIDHINGDKTDNRIANLRVVSWSGNSHNRTRAHKSNKTGYLGVVRLADRADGSPRFGAFIRTKTLHKNLGTFPDPVSAHEAYVAAKRALHPTCTI